MFDEQENCQHDRNLYREHNKPVTDNSRQQESDKGNSRNDTYIRQLCRNVGDMIALCTRRRHHSRIRNGGTVVTADSPGKTCRHADEEQRAFRRENTADNGNENTERPPGCSRGKCQQAGNNKDHRREKLCQPGCRIADQVSNEFLTFQRGCKIFQPRSHRQNKNGGYHGIEAADNAF